VGQRALDRGRVGDVHVVARQQAVGRLRFWQMRAKARPRVPVAPVIRIGRTLGADQGWPSAVIEVSAAGVATGGHRKRPGRRHQPWPRSTGCDSGLPDASSRIMRASAVGRGSGERTSKGPGS
jgi:hypothetical protein